MSKVSVDTELERMKVVVAGKTEAEREFQSIKVIVINNLGNAFVRIVSISIFF